MYVCMFIVDCGAFVLYLKINLINMFVVGLGNLLDDEELITVLADTKLKSTDVKEKLIAAAVPPHTYTTYKPLLH